MAGQSRDAEGSDPALYTCRTRDGVWHWCIDCPDHPLAEKNTKSTGVLDNNGLLSSTTKPTGFLCPQCTALTKAQEHTA